MAFPGQMDAICRDLIHPLCLSRLLQLLPEREKKGFLILSGCLPDPPGYLPEAGLPGFQTGRSREDKGLHYKNTVAAFQLQPF